MRQNQRILIIGDSPFVTTGFGRLCREIGLKLHESGFAVGCIGLWDKRPNDGMQEFNGYKIPYKVWGCKTQEFDAFALGLYQEILNEFDPTSILCITDLWIAAPFLERSPSYVKKNFYFHVEGGPLPVSTAGIKRQVVNWPDTLLMCDNVIFAGPFGQETTFSRLDSYVKETKKVVDLNVLKEQWPVIPNGIDVSVFKPLDNKEQLKRDLWHLPGDSFIIGFFGRQQPRKGLPYALEAFANWKDKPKNAFFYCHCPLSDPYGWDLKQLIKDLKIDDRVLVNTRVNVDRGVTEEELNRYYNACDLVVSPSLGEGFGQTTCLVPDMYVRTKHVHVPIQNIKAGMKVFTSEGHFKEVEEVFKTWYEGNVVTINFKDSPSITVTPKHKIMSGSWTEAQNLKKGKYTVHPKIKNPRFADAICDSLNLDKIFYKRSVTDSPAIVLAIRDALYDLKNNILNVVKKGRKNWKINIFRNRIPDSSNGLIRHEIKNIKTEEYKGYVYNLNVKEDHNFVVNGTAVVHNCQSLASGVPVIVTDYSELSNFKRGVIKIPPKVFYVEPRTNIRRALVTIQDLVHAYRKVHKDFLSGRIRLTSQEAVKEGKIYDWNDVSKQWIKFFDDLPITERQLSMAKVSIVVPTYNSNVKYLEECFASLIRQTHKNMEVVVVDDGSTEKDHFPLLDKVAELPQFKIIKLEKNLGIAGSTTIGIENCTGDYIGFVDADDKIKSLCIEKTVKYMENNKDIGMVYTDEELIEADGSKIYQIYKEDYNEDLLLQMMYINHFRLGKTYMIKEFLPLQYTGAQDFDLALRFSEKYKIGHLREVLYAWRKSETSTTSQGIKKEYEENNRQAVLAALGRRKINASVAVGPMPTQWKITRPLVNNDLASIIILTKDKPQLIKDCVNSILEHTKYPYELIVVDTGSTDKETLDYYETMKQHKQIILLSDVFHFSKTNNKAAKVANGNYIVFLNNDTIVTPGWLTGIMQELQRPEVAVVGPKLLFKDGRIQHAGLVLGYNGLAGHIHIGKPQNYWPTMFTREISAVTGACLAIKKDIFEAIGGFDEQYMIEFQDVDLCLKVKTAGHKIIYTPHSIVYHITSATRGNPSKEEALNDRSRFSYIWKNEISTVDFNLPYNLIDHFNKDSIKQWNVIYTKLNKKDIDNASGSGNPNI